MDIRNTICSVEQLSGGDTCLHRLHPLSKLFAALVFIVTVASFNRYAFMQMIPLIFYPTIIMALSEIPWGLLLKRVLIALPFCLFAGVSNLIFEPETAFSIGHFSVSVGAVSFITLLYRTFLCVVAVLILIATTPMNEIASTLRQIHIPTLFVITVEMIYRYIVVLFDEAASMRIAYTLRSGNQRGVDIRHAGEFIGCLLLRSFDRAERLYSAMKCRGYTLKNYHSMTDAPTLCDLLYCVLIASFCAFWRLFDINRLLNLIFWRFS